MADKTVCARCGGQGFVSAGYGRLALCGCKEVEILREAYRPIIRLCRENVMSVPTGKVERRNQAVVRSDQNIACFINYIVKAWGTRPDYDLRAIEELNSIGIKGTREYRTLSDYAQAFDRFVIDWSVENPLRGKGWQEKDEMVLLELAKIVGARPNKELFIIIGPTAKEFKATHKVMCEVLEDMGLPIYDREKYWRFAPKKVVEGAGVAGEREADDDAD